VEPNLVATDFTLFVKEAEPRLRYALVAGYGPDRGLDGTAEAFAYAWENWDRVRSMDNPTGYLFRVGQHHAARGWPNARLFPEPASNLQPWVEPALPRALGRLTAKQRVTVVLVWGYGYTHKEVAEVLGTSIPTVQKHLARGLAKLRSALGVTEDA
jgi:RNA polymerase sigma-70 factor (ECF subfamily)